MGGAPLPGATVAIVPVVARLPAAASTSARPDATARWARDLLSAIAVVAPFFLAVSLAATPFVDATALWLGPTPTAGWSNKIELCDADDDGDVDAFVANGAAYSEADAPELPFFWRNAGDRFVVDDLPVPAGWWRVVKCADVDGDGDSDVFFGGTFQSRSFLALNAGGGTFVDGSDRLPDDVASFGDAEFADLDGDGRVDLALADWGAGDPLGNGGAPPRLWMQRGEPGDPWFVDEGATRLPAGRAGFAGFSWDLEAVDVDDDLDLDLVVACKVCSSGGLLLKNQLAEEGNARFVDDSAHLPGSGNNYDFEVLDVDDDGDMDLFTVNDGPNLSERLLKNDRGVYVDGAGFAAGVNSGVDDNAAFVLDVDGDDDEDVFVASLSGDDRVLENEGGVFVRSVIATDGVRTRGSLAAAAADLDDDGRLDLVMGQGESAFDDLVYVGRDVVVDDQAPELSRPRFDRARRRLLVRAWDHVTPVRDVDVAVTARFDGGARVAPLRRAGERYWQTGVLSGDGSVVVCAADRRGNEACSDVVVLADGEGEGEGEEGEGDVGAEGEGKGEGAAEGEGDVVAEGEGDVAHEGEVEVCDGRGCSTDGDGPGDVVTPPAPSCQSANGSAARPLFIVLVVLLGQAGRRRRMSELSK